jgi:urea transport system substrate-binding protein
MKPRSQADATCAFIESAGQPAENDAPEKLDLSFLSPPIDPGELGWLAHYRIWRVLGSGGMGIVFEAEDTHLHRSVALKVMRKELAEKAVTRERFLQEARAIAALNSDYIVTVYQVGVANDVPYLAMQFLRGESLQDRLERKGRLPLGDALTIAKQTASGLADAQAIGLVHRDIKPANLWLESDGPGDAFKRVRILDFGLARRDEDTRLTATGVVVGTPHFMAPEQAGGKTVDGRADLFSLGGVIYTMLTGELAFDGDSVMSVLMALATRDVPPLAERCPDIPVELSALVTRLLARDPRDRPHSAAAVVAELEAIQAQLPNPGLVPKIADPRTGLTAANTATGGQTSASGPKIKALGSTEQAALSPTVVDAASLHSRRSWLGGLLVGAGCVAIGLGGFAYYLRKDRGPNTIPPQTISKDPIVVGILHSQSGTMALSESPLIDACVLAVEEINAAGGVLGRPLKHIIRDGASEPETFAKWAEKLLAEDHAAAIFGCWTSAARRTVKPIIERQDSLLFYPVQYEGLEQSPRIVYLGSTPNQQLFPAVDFLIDQLGKRKLLLVGSDYIYPRAADEILRDYVKQRGGADVVGAVFVTLGEKNVSTILDAIRRTQPDAIVNVLNGSTNVYFFNGLRDAGLTSDRLPTISLSISENMLRTLDVSKMSNDYLAASYFQSVENPVGLEFTRKLQTRFDNNRPVTDAMASAYSAVHLWAKAAQAAGHADAHKVLTTLSQQVVDSPFGTIRVDPKNHHVAQTVRIGQVQPDGQLRIVGGSDRLIPPEPWPTTRSRLDWERFLNNLYVGWDERWQAPAKP